MSTLAYASLTNRREQAAPETSTSTSPPGVSTYVDALAALVPAEVLTLHAIILSVTTETAQGATKIVAPETLIASFYALAVLAVVLYVVGRLLSKQWDRLDYLRAAIPPLAFVGWTMMQRATAFDAVAPKMSAATRTVVALFLAVVLGLATAALANRADKKTP